MKKFFEKYDLVKIAGILVLISVVLTWIIPFGYFSGSEMVTEEITRIGITNFFQYGLLGMYYFTVLVTFLFVLGGFYQVLSKRPGYQKVVKTLASKLKGFDVTFVLITSLLFAIAGSMVTEYFPLIALIPFIISVMNRMKIDKISSFIGTFGGLLVGAIGSTYSPKVAGYLTDTFAVEASDVLITQTILFIIAYLLLALFTVLRMRKQKKSRDFESYDKFETELAPADRKVRTWPTIVGIVLFVIVTIFGYLPWEQWNITIFSDITTWVNELAITIKTKEIPIISYICGEFSAFGSWDIFQLQFVMLFITILYWIFGKTSLDEIFDDYGEGFKKMGSTVIVLLVVYLVLELAVMYPVVPTIVAWFADKLEGMNVLVGMLSAFISSIFGVEMQYVMSLSGAYLASVISNAGATLTIIFQSIFGLVSFFVPSSAILMLGLSYLGIPYKDWMKFIWKFLLAMFAIIIVIVVIIA